MIRKEIPEATCIIAGQRADEKIGKVNSPGIEIIDIASSDTDKVVEVFTKGSIFLAPLEGPGGTRLKILGAMAAGMPVVSSKTGVSGLEVKHGKHAYICLLYTSLSVFENPKIHHPNQCLTRSHHVLPVSYTHLKFIDLRF